MWLTIRGRLQRPSPAEAQGSIFLRNGSKLRGRKEKTSCEIDHPRNLCFCLEVIKIQQRFDGFTMFFFSFKSSTWVNRFDVAATMGDGDIILWVFLASDVGGTIKWSTWDDVFDGKSVEVPWVGVGMVPCTCRYTIFNTSKQTGNWKVWGIVRLLPFLTLVSSME